MGKTFAQLKAAILSWMEIGEDDADERLDDSTAGDIINIVRRQYLRRRESKLGQDTKIYNFVGYTASYAYPEDFSKPRKLWYMDPVGKVQICDPLNKDEFDVEYPYSTLLSIGNAPAVALEGGGLITLEGGGSLLMTPEIASLAVAEIGAPLHYCIWKGKIVLGPCPNADLIAFFDYWGVGKDYVAGTDQDRFLLEAWEYLLFAALAKASEYGVEDERVGIWMKEAVALEEALDLEDARQLITGRKQIQSREP